MLQLSITKLCAFVVQSVRVIRNALIDQKFGSLLSGKIPTKYSDKGAVDTVNSDYIAIARLCFGHIDPGDILVDIGCGKGRVIKWWIGQEYGNRIIGIELDPVVAGQTRRRFSHVQNVDILDGDAAEIIPRSGTIFYLYNPFNRKKMMEFQTQLVKRSHDISRVRLLYNNCKHVDVFESDDNWRVKRIDIGGSRFKPFDAAALISWTP